MDVWPQRQPIRSSHDSSWPRTINLDGYSSLSSRPSARQTAIVTTTQVCGTRARSVLTIWRRDLAELQAHAVAVSCYWRKNDTWLAYRSLRIRSTVIDKKWYCNMIIRLNTPKTLWLHRSCCILCIYCGVHPHSIPMLTKLSLIQDWNFQNWSWGQNWLCRPSWKVGLSYIAYQHIITKKKQKKLSK